MKKKLAFSLFLGILFLSALSFTLVKERYTAKKVAIVNKKTVKKPTCTANITSFTLVSVTSTSFTVSWTYSGSPASFNYGGYYNPHGGITPGNTTSTTLTLPIPPGACGARIGVLCVCSDGTTVGQTHGVLFGCGDPTIYF